MKLSMVHTVIGALGTIPKCLYEGSGAHGVMVIVVGNG